MNPNAPSNNFELPQPQVSETVEGSKSLSNKNTAARPEKGTQSPPKIPVQTSSSAPQKVPQQDDGVKPSATGITSSTQTGNPSTADDTDLIEKEWVTKAKQIVSSTKDDPHTQNKEISKFRADYLKKRYHKDIKIEET